MATQKEVEDAVNRYGFNLEYDTKKILYDNGFKADVNQLIVSGSEHVEVDVLATKEILFFHVIIECKGAEKDSVLILVGASDHMIEKVYNDPSLTRYKITNTEYQLPIYGVNNNNDLYTMTGDFFRQSKTKLTKCAKDDDRNNYYKAQKQMMNAVSLYAKTPPKNEDNDKNRQDKIIPLIVTNADIWIVDYKSNTSIQPYKWALQCVVANDELDFGKCKEDPKEPYLIIPIVNINYLSELLKNFDKIRQQLIIPSGKLSN